MSLNDTPKGNRLHIGIFGRRNSGKSSLINALTGQNISLVSDTPGTTTDPVMKAMELHPIGPVVFMDTAGFDDEGELGLLRIQRTEDILSKTDIAILLIEEPDEVTCEKLWEERLTARKIPTIKVLNKSDLHKNDFSQGGLNQWTKDNGSEPIIDVSAKTGYGLDRLRRAIEAAVPENLLREQILQGLIDENGLALLVMPQDIQAPKGRLILPQVQTLRELLDRKCTAAATTADGFQRTLEALNKAPDLIITDSQCFDEVYRNKPEKSLLTSFSVLFAAYKGDVDAFIKGASALDYMTENSRVLIAEACTHVPLSEDIGTVKIPRALRKKLGEGLETVNVCGNDFPEVEELKSFDLIVHCGGCMFNRKHVLSRIEAAQQAGVPITNYGIILAKLSGILDKISVPSV